MDSGTESNIFAAWMADRLLTLRLRWWWWYSRCDVGGGGVRKPRRWKLRPLRNLPKCIRRWEQAISKEIFGMYLYIYVLKFSRIPNFSSSWNSWVLRISGNSKCLRIVGILEIRNSGNSRIPNFWNFDVLEFPNSKFLKLGIPEFRELLEFREFRNSKFLKFWINSKVLKFWIPGIPRNSELPKICGNSLT